MANKRDAKDWAREHMTGLWTSPMFPFTQDYALDEAGMRANVDYIINCKAAGIGFGFSEPWVCSMAERKRAMEVSIDAIRGRVHSYLHATDHSVEETIGLVKHAQAVGAEAVMLWTPYEWANSQDTIYDYYEYVSSRTDIAIFAYNTYHSGTAMTPETVARIAKLPGVCAVKNAINDVSHTLRCMELAGKDIVIASSNEQFLLMMTLEFGQQLLIGTTSVFLMQSPFCQPIQEYWELARAGRGAEASAKYYELQPLREVWGTMYLPLRNKKGAAHPLPQIKCWMELMGMAAGPVRPPMHNITEAEKAELRARVQATGWIDRLFPQRKAAA